MSEKVEKVGGTVVWKDRQLTAWRRSLASTHLADATIENYVSAVRRYLDWVGLTSSDELSDPKHVAAWFDATAHSSVGTARAYWTAMRAFWQWAYANGRVNSNPMVQVPRPRATVLSIDDLLAAHLRPARLAASA